MRKKLTKSKYRMLKPAKTLHHNLLRWFDAEKRAMPWRETRDPYAIWLSETMLQQTQVETVKPYYHRFLQAFPTVADLARADLQEVLSLWAGLGYYRRARHLHLAAQKMVELHRGRVPETVEALLSLPGIGRYTAGAVGSIAFGLAEPVVDGNVMRVISRLTGFDREIGQQPSLDFFWRVAGEILEGAMTSDPLPAVSGQKAGNETRDAVVSHLGAGALRRDPPRYGDINQAMMELGAMVCMPTATPACEVCPVREFCRARAEGRQAELPVKKKRAEVPIVRGAALVITRSQKSGARSQKAEKEVLVMQRPRGAGVVWEEMWEMPVLSFEFQVSSFERGRGDGLKLETQNSKLRAWAQTVLGTELGRTEECGTIVHVLTHRRMEFLLVRGEAASGQSSVVSGQKEKTGNTNRKTPNVGTRNWKLETGNSEAVLPVGVGMGEKRYVGWRWVKWPLERVEGLPMARVVWKVAQRVEAAERGR